METCLHITGGAKLALHSQLILVNEAECNSCANHIGIFATTKRQPVRRAANILAVLRLNLREAGMGDGELP